MADAPLTLAIFGASGATGGHAVSAARRRGHRVIGLDREDPAAHQAAQCIDWRKADVLSDDLSEVLKGADAVLSCLGVGNDPRTLLSPPPLYTEGTAAICDAMQTRGLDRLIVISATFVEVRNRGPVWFRLPAMVGLARVFDQMAQMEAQLRRRDGLAWTAVRPGWLMDGEFTGDYTVQADVIPPNLIRTRHADLADFMVRLAEGRDWLRQTPAIARPEDDDKSSPRAVANEIIG